jgi:hypothetical protein
VLPFIYALLQGSAGTASPSLDPDDPESLVGIGQGAP